MNIAKAQADKVGNYFKSFDYKQFFQNILLVISKPAEGWAKIKTDNQQPLQIFLVYVLPATIMALVVNLVFAILKLSPAGGIGLQIVQAVAALIGYFIVGSLVYFIAKIKFFEATISKEAAFQLAGVLGAVTQILGIPVTAITALVGWLGALTSLAAGIYSIYLLVKGFKALTEIVNKIAYFPVLIVAIAISYIVLGTILFTPFAASQVSSYESNPSLTEQQKQELQKYEEVMKNLTNR